MTSFTRKIKRTKKVKESKVFKKTFKNYLKSVMQCVSCGRSPSPGEKIDKWHINTSSDKDIQLKCIDCVGEQEAH